MVGDVRAGDVLLLQLQLLLLRLLLTANVHEGVEGGGSSTYGVMLVWVWAPVGGKGDSPITCVMLRLIDTAIDFFFLHALIIHTAVIVFVHEGHGCAFEALLAPKTHVDDITGGANFSVFF